MPNTSRIAGWLRTCLLTLVSAAPWITGAAYAGGFTVSPVLVSLDAGQRSTAITLTNGSGQPQRIQAEIMRWSKSASGEDVLEPESKILLNPPLFDLAPGASQIVRLGFRSNAMPPTDRESTWRVFFQEVPREDADGNTQQLQMVLRVGVPVFAAPKSSTRSLKWSAQRQADKLVVRLDNQGNVHARVSNLRVSQPPSGAEQKAEGFVYVFAGHTQKWTLPAAQLAGSAPLFLDAMTDGGAVHVELPLAQD